MILHHYAHEPLEEIKSKRYGKETRMGCFTKPRGLWVSVDGEHGWEEWCRAENFSHMGTFKYRVDLIPGANILVLTSPEELDTFDAKYGVEETYPPLSGLNIPGYTFRRIDWLKVRRKYDGIIIAPYIWERRLSHLEWYYTWDCASGCIWRRNPIQAIEFVKEVPAVEPYRYTED